MLIGTALTTIFIAFPLGPGTTAAAYTGDSAVVSRSGSETGRTAAGIGPAAPTTPDSAHIHRAAAHIHRAVAEVAAIGPSLHSGVPDPDPIAEAATDAPAALGSEPTPAPGGTQPGSGHHGEAGPADTGSRAGDTTGAPSGSSRKGSCGTGSNAGSAAGSSSVCRMIPLLRDLVRELVKLAPQPVPACPCPGRAL
ncbi:hypothetical protein [Nocardia sp. NPDC003963]